MFHWKLLNINNFFILYSVIKALNFYGYLELSDYYSYKVFFYVFNRVHCILCLTHQSLLRFSQVSDFQRTWKTYQIHPSAFKTSKKKFNVIEIIFSPSKKHKWLINWKSIYTQSEFRNDFPNRFTSFSPTFFTYIGPKKIIKEKPQNQFSVHYKAKQHWYKHNSITISTSKSIGKI